ncbi:MAG TPA: HepT-like ribonuclease domain-containing protein [Candidatus Nanoarchaeia archaeon]|nr:HepT-like ribonuclease domain-containing protein [Candidatus Nanoarchaeia archaeon]
MIQKIKLSSNDRVKDKLDELVSYHRELVEDLPERDEFKQERLVKRGIEKTIELIADTIVDIALIIISERGLKKPEDSRDALSVLEENKILTKKVAGKIKDLISFRNLLVHRYGKIKEDLEYTNISENSEDIILFVKEIEISLKDKLKVQ